MDSVVAVKQCSKCGEVKSVTEFVPDRRLQSGIKAHCKSCRDVAHRVWRKNNPNYVPPCLKCGVSKYWAEWRVKNPDSYIKSQVKYASSHREDKRLKALSRMRTDQKAHNERTTKWKNENRDRENELKRLRYAKNPEPRRAIDLRRRVRKLNAPGSHTQTEISALLIKQKHVCANPYCSVGLEVSNRTVDHIVALARGGSNSIENLQWLCRRCNGRKKDLELDVWLSREALRTAKAQLAA